MLITPNEMMVFWEVDWTVCVKLRPWKVSCGWLQWGQCHMQTLFKGFGLCVKGTEGAFLRVAGDTGE